MDLTYFLTMTDVAVERDTIVTDGMGGVTTSVVSTTLSRAIIYQEGSTTVFRGYRAVYADKVTQESSHILVCEPSAYSWTLQDQRVKQGGRTFDIVGTPYNIMGLDELMMVGLKQQL